MDEFGITPAIQQTLEEMEVIRKKLAAKIIQGWLLIGLGVILLFALFSFNLLVIGIVIGACLIIPGAFTLFKISDDRSGYRLRFKQEIIGAILKSVSTSFTFDQDKGIYESEFMETQLFTKEPDAYKTEDLICGQLDKTAFFFAEVHAEYKTETQTKNGRQIQWHDIFKGILFAADFNKNFNGITVVRPKDFGSSIGAWFSKNIYSFGDKNLIDLENEYFNEHFVTYSTDQVEARYILTPALMERIQNLNERSSYCVSLSFTNTNMYIAFPLDKNYFEAPVFSSLLDSNILSDDLSVLQFMYGIVQELDLNTRIWTKS